MRRCFFSFLLALVFSVFCGCQHQAPLLSAPPVAQQAPQDALKDLLAVNPACWLPELDLAEAPILAQSPGGQEILAWAKAALDQPATPETTYSLYRRFSSHGERSPYESPYFEKRSLLTKETLLVWLGGDTSRLGRVQDLIWNICEESTWVIPAHEKGPEFVDLFCAETAVQLAHVDRLLGDQLAKEIHERIYAEIDRRVFQNYLAHARDFWYDCGRNNWTGVCAGSVGQAFLMLEPDLDRQAQAVLLVNEQLGRFLENAFEPDGVCLEGIGYWNYGLIRYIAYAEMLRRRTQGAIDILANEKMERVARYPLAVSLGGHAFASFSDAHEHGDVRPYLAAFFADRYGVEDLRGLSGGLDSFRLGTVLRNLLWAGKAMQPPPVPEDIVLPESGLARLVGLVDGQPLALAAKAGSNGEPHNHNDVGSFILRIGGVTYLADPGPGLYSKAYFSSARYENAFANSYGHSLPRIGGALQEKGEAHCGRLEQTGPKAITIRFEKAYALDTLNKVERRLRITETGILLEDAFEFIKTPMPVEEALVTWLPVAAYGKVAEIASDKGVLRIQADQGEFKVEELTEASKENHRSGVLRRLSLNLPRQEHQKVRFTMTFKAAR